MPRNSRAIRDWTPEWVSALPVAPHRYRWNDDSEPCEQSYKAVKAAAPYQPGDVVYIAYGAGYVRARIMHVFVRRNYREELVEYYRTQRETKKGLWSKLYWDVHPGYIQRGYQRAGLAPEMPEDA